MSRQREGSTECEEAALCSVCIYVRVRVCRGPGCDDLGYWGNNAVYSSCGGSFEEEAQMRSALGLAKCTAKTRNNATTSCGSSRCPHDEPARPLGPGTREPLLSDTKAEAQMSAVSHRRRP